MDYATVIERWIMRLESGESRVFGGRGHGSAEVGLPMHQWKNTS